MVVPVDVDGPYRHLRQRDVREQQWRARRCVDRRVEGHEHTNQLEIAPKTAADWERVLGQTISTAVEYYPIPVMLNGGPLARRDFLAGAMLVHEADGIRYGVYEEERSRDPLNGYGRGLLLAGMGPRVRTIDGRTFLVAIDIAGGQVPPLREPHRWELAETEAAEGLRKEGRLACLRAIAGLEQQPPLGYKDHVAATEAGIACRPAPARLLPWRGETVLERHHRWSPQSAAERVLATDGIVVERSFRQHEEATLVEAMRTSGNDAMLLERHYRLKAIRGTTACRAWSTCGSKDACTVARSARRICARPGARRTPRAWRRRTWCSRSGAGRSNANCGSRPRSCWCARRYPRRGRSGPSRTRATHGRW